MSFHKPTNIAPFRRTIHKLVRQLHKKCITDKGIHERLFYPNAWASFLLWDFRSAPVHKDGLRILDLDGVRKYPNYKKIQNGVFATKQVPDDWVEQSMDALLAAEILFDNCRTGERRRFKPSRSLVKYWDEVTALEQRYDPYSSKDILLNVEVVSRLRRMERVLRQVCHTVGVEPMF